jgi:signal transduction histidine kinase
LANALEVAPPQSTIRLTASPDRSFVDVHVVDEGPGMDPEHRAHAFDRFWRGDSGHRGSGLGLSIVQKLVQADGGDVTLDEAPSGGLDVRIRLRRAS